MSALVDRGARILDPYAFDPPPDDNPAYAPQSDDERRGRQAVAREQVRKIIASMREPTEEMSEAAVKSTVRWLNFGHGSALTVNLLKAAHRWRAMIDAALSDADASGREE